MITHNKDKAFTGYLGNRMFQTAATIGIAVENGQEYGFLDNGHMGCFKNFMLCNPTEITSKNFTDMSEGGFGYKKLSLNPGVHYNLSGYFQSEKYFKHCEDKIKNLFEFRDNIVDSAKSTLDAIRTKHPGKKIVGMHLRLGDYLNLKEHHTCLMDTNYYFNAINMAGLDDSVFVVFNNDVSTAEKFMLKLKGQLSTLTYEVQHIGPAPVDMCMMSLCDAQVIANSSFSWWAAWLSKSDIKIAPQKERWFGPAYSDMEVNDIIPTGWRQAIC